jgi:predicted DNA-binding transcriptional regulator YafY
VSVNERRNEIIRILRGTRLISVSCLAETLNVSVSTIKRDILALTVDEGYSIDTVMGKKGGIVLTDFRHPHKHILSQEQIKVLTELIQTANTYNAEILSGILNAYS